MRHEVQYIDPHAQNDLTRTTLLVLFIGLLIVGSLWTMLPFLGALVWATTIVVATWPLMLRVQRLAGGSRTIATVVMTVLALTIFIVPFWFAIGGLIDAASPGADLVRTYSNEGAWAPAGVAGQGALARRENRRQMAGTGYGHAVNAGCNDPAACRHDCSPLAGDHRRIRNGLRAFRSHGDHCRNSLFKR